MDKTININIAGILFKIDEDAFSILRDYLQAINNSFRDLQGGNETIEDIESRVAEIFQSQKGLAGVITKENVEAMISIIGRPEDFDHNESETKAPVYTSVKKRMYRNPDDSIISGVCSGLAAYLDSDPVLFRILFVIFAIFFGVGFFVYLALWIALPAAKTDAQKREMYGSSYHTNIHNSTSRVKNAIDEVFRAIVKVFYIIFRIILIFIGIVLVLTGFLFILSFVMVFIFKFPGVFSIDSSGINLVNFTDFLNYIVRPASVLWVTILTSIVLILPMLALIYWGVKMIFWFKARDGIVSLVALVVWVMALAALTIIGLNEGISFAHSANTSTDIVIPNPPDTLHIRSDSKISDLRFEKDFILPHEQYSVYINDERKELYIRPGLAINRSDDKATKIEVKKSSAGRTWNEAEKKSEELKYNYAMKGDTLLLDEYFTIPAERRWAADDIRINLFIPAGTILKFEKDPRILIRSSFRDELDRFPESRWESGNSLWKMTDDGLKPAAERSLIQK